MSYDLETNGILEDILYTEFHTTKSDRRLQTPACVYATRIKIALEDGGSLCTEVYGKVPRKYIGNIVRLRDIYRKNKDGTKMFKTILCANGELVVDQAIRTRY